MRPIALERHKALSRLRGGMSSRDLRLPMFPLTSHTPPTPSGYYHPHPQPLVVAALSGRTGAGFRCLEAPRGSVAFWSGVCPSGLRVRLLGSRRLLRLLRAVFSPACGVRSAAFTSISRECASSGGPQARSCLWISDAEGFWWPHEPRFVSAPPPLVPPLP